MYTDLVTVITSLEEPGLGVWECETTNFKMTWENGMWKNARQTFMFWTSIKNEDF